MLAPEGVDVWETYEYVRGMYCIHMVGSGPSVSVISPGSASAESGNGAASLWTAPRLKRRAGETASKIKHIRMLSLTSQELARAG